MTTSYHTPVSTGAAANASTINNPLGQLDAALVAMDTRIDNIVYGGVDLADPLVFESGLTVNDQLIIDVSRTLNEDDSGKINLPVWITGTYTTPGDDYSVRAVYCSTVSAGTHDIATLSGFYAQTDYASSAGRLTHGWGVVGRFIKSGAGTVQQCAGVYSDFTVSGEGLIDAAYGYYQNPGNVSAGQIANCFQIDINEPTVSGTGVINGNYGIRVGTTTVGTTRNYGIYIEESAGWGLYSVSQIETADDLTVGGDSTLSGDLDVANGDVTILGDSTVGGELITNGGFDSDTTGWTATNATIASVSGGQSGNCLKVTNVSSNGYASQSITTVIGATYRLTFYRKSVDANMALYVGTSAGGSQLLFANLPTAADWMLNTYFFTATTTTTHFRLSMSGSPAAGTTALWDTISCVQMLGGNLSVNGKITGYGGTAGIAIASATGVVTADNRVDAEGGFRTDVISIADDVVVDLRALYPNLANGGILQISTVNYGNSAGLITYRAAASPFCIIIAQPASDIVVGTTALTNGTSDGTDGKVNVAATSSGELFLKNRRGGTATFVVTVFA